MNAYRSQVLGRDLLEDVVLIKALSFWASFATQPSILPWKAFCVCIFYSRRRCIYQSIEEMARQLRLESLQECGVHGFSRARNWSACRWEVDFWMGHFPSIPEKLWPMNLLNLKWLLIHQLKMYHQTTNLVATTCSECLAGTLKVVLLFCYSWELLYY